MTLPKNEEAERSVIGHMLSKPTLVSEISATMLTGGDFFDRANGMIYDHLVEAFYADDPTDPLTVGATLAPRLVRLWGCTEDQVVPRVHKLASVLPSGRVVDHAGIVKRASDGRRLLALASGIQAAVSESDLTPEAIAGQVSHDAMKIATSAMVDSEIIQFGDAGRRYVTESKRIMAAYRAGLRLGVHVEIPAIDNYTAGIQPTELLIAAGEPGVGKSGLWWRGALNFAKDQARRPKDKQIATLILSLEMGAHPSNNRVAQMLTGIPSETLRTGEMSDAQLKFIVDEWGAKRDYPLFFNYAASVRASQLRALVSEGIRRYNVGFVVIDHFRMFRMDSPPRNPVDHDEEKAIFLKEQIAKELNVAVVCLAHTRKTDDPNGRPRLSDLRGSGQISAHADFVNFLYRPFLYDGDADEHSAELIWAKNRHSKSGTTEFHFNLETMFAM